MTGLRDLPSVDRLLGTAQGEDLVSDYGHLLTVKAAREVLGDIRNEFKNTQTLPEEPQILSAVQERLQDWVRPTLSAVINATGTVLHTNLGRAPLSKTAMLAVLDISQTYNTLEFDLEAGKRGSRLLHAEELLRRLTGAEAALVVNNNASAVLLALTALARRQRVIVSRTQLVEIGGGFRIPDVMKQSGARLVEIGTTNRVHLSDYEKALEKETAFVMRAHHSNYKIIGFSSEPDLKDIVDLTHAQDTLVMDDLGSGALLDTTRFGLSHEPMVQESLQAGVDLVCFSGDKLLGGPQAGIILGRSELIKKIKKHPLARAVRSDKLCLSALSATLTHYLKGEALQEIPIWRMISMGEEEIKTRAHAWKKQLSAGVVTGGFSKIGGGSLPEETLPTWLLALKPQRPDNFMKLLRSLPVPVIARIQEEKVVFDPRTVMPEQETKMLALLKELLLTQNEEKSQP